MVLRLLMGLCLLWTLGQLGCKAEVNSCAGPENCPADQACIDAVCQPRECISNQDCPLNQLCSTTDGRCIDGCTSDGDCAYGSICTGGSCQEQRCTSTEVDCSLGEFCDTVTGTCFKAAGPYCAPCSSSADCGTGNSCRTVGGTGPFCMVSCDATHPCPAGYSCEAFPIYDDVYAYYCYALCGYINDLKTTGSGGNP